MLNDRLFDDLTKFKMVAKFNKFTKDPISKTGFVLLEGQPIFTETVYLLQPHYVHKRSPALTLVSKGRRVTGLFQVCGGALLGNFNKKALIVFMRGELGFDLFQTDLPPSQAKALLCNGQLNDLLSQARQAA